MAIRRVSNKNEIRGQGCPRAFLFPQLGWRNINYVRNRWIYWYQDAKEILLKGLEKLEYRGYDSAGIAVKNDEGVTVFKEKGRIADLRAEV